MELLIDYELFNAFCFGALPSLGLPRIIYRNILYIIIYCVSFTCKSSPSAKVTWLYLVLQTINVVLKDGLQHYYHVWLPLAKEM